jgi:tetratricopeptide (TPR) repeat protein
VIDELTSYSLIKVSARNNEYSIHQLVHAWARDRTTVTERQETHNCVMQILALSIEFEFSADDYAFQRTLIPHIDESLANNVECELAERFWLAYYEHGRLNLAKKLQLQVMEERTRALGEDHPDTLRSMSNLANTYWSQGRFTEAEQLRAQILGTRERVLGEDHPDALTSISNLADTYWSQGWLKEAEQLGVQVLGARKRVLGEDHPDTLKSMNNLAVTYRDQGRLKEAEQLEVQILEASKRVLGKDHPHTLTSMNNLAITYWKQAGSRGQEKSARGGSS